MTKKLKIYYKLQNQFDIIEVSRYIVKPKNVELQQLIMDCFVEFKQNKIKVIYIKDSIFDDILRSISLYNQKYPTNGIAIIKDSIFTLDYQNQENQIEFFIRRSSLAEKDKEEFNKIANHS